MPWSAMYLANGAVLGRLADGFVKQDGAGDVLVELRRGQQQFAVGTTVLLGARYRRQRTLGDGSGGFVDRDDALPGATMAWAVSASVRCSCTSCGGCGKTQYSPAARCAGVQARMETIPMSAQDKCPATRGQSPDPTRASEVAQADGAAALPLPAGAGYRHRGFPCARHW